MRKATLTALLLWAAACSDPKVVCPKGYHADGQFCYADEAPPPQCQAGQHVEEGVCVDDPPPQDATGSQDAAAPDTASASDAGKDAPSSPDVAPDVAAKPDAADAKDTKPQSKAPVGSACFDDLDCSSGLACYSWPKGYCTLPNCQAPGSVCPGSSTCWGESPTSMLCIAACDSDADCRAADGYACKRLTQQFGSVDASLCLPGGKAPAGMNCTKPLDCAGTATCLTDMPGGYCAQVGCGLSDPCGAGTACVLRNGKPVCLKTCATDTECQIPTKQARKCVDKTDLGKKAVKVCLDTTKSGPVGSPCLSDLDCDSKLCTLYAKGTCQTGGEPCLTDGQCGAAGPCVLDASKEKGICSAPCSKDKACPVGGVCVPSGADSASGTCQPACKGPGDDAVCAVPGNICLFGVPLSTPSGPGTPSYACAPQPKGSPGAPCSENADCSGKVTCMTNADATAGFCTGPCDGGAGCPFGTACLDTGIAFCAKICSGDYDCPPLMACKASSQASAKICKQP